MESIILLVLYISLFSIIYLFFFIIFSLNVHIIQALLKNHQRYVHVLAIYNNIVNYKKKITSMCIVRALYILYIIHIIVIKFCEVL
jgi:hypothetical protein